MGELILELILGIDPVDAGHSQRRGDDLAEINRRTEGEIIRVKETPPTIGQIRVAEGI